MYELSLSLVNPRPDFRYDMYTTVYADKDWIESYNAKYEFRIKHWRDMQKAEVGDWFSVGITLGLAAVDANHSEKAKREALFPLALTDTGTSFMCSAGQASVEEDRVRILEEIGHESSLLDDRVHSVVATAALNRVLNEQNEQRQMTYLEAIRKCPPPELRLSITNSEVDAQETMSAVIEALAFRDGCKMFELKTDAPSIPASIGNLTALRSLKLEGCRNLTSLPEAIGGLTALQTLHLEGCCSLTSLPEAIGGLTALRSLHLEGCCSLTSLPEAISGLTALQTLHLEGCCSLTSLPEAIGGLTALRSLHLEGCRKLISLPDLPGVKIVRS